MTGTEAEKIDEFVQEGVRWLGAKVLGRRRLKTRLVYRVGGCDLGRLEDFVNQRFGHYAYGYIGWTTARGELAVG